VDPGGGGRETKAEHGREGSRRRERGSKSEQAEGQERNPAKGREKDTLARTRLFVSVYFVGTRMYGGGFRGRREMGRERKREAGDRCDAAMSRRRSVEATAATW